MPSRALRARKSGNPAIETPPSGRNPAIETPPRGVRDPIISSAWTSKRARTGSYASLVRGGVSIAGFSDFRARSARNGAEGAILENFEDFLKILPN